MNLLRLWWTDTFDLAHCRIAHGIQHLCETDCDKRRRWCIIVEVSPEWCVMVEMFILEWTFAFIMVMIDILSLILWISGH